MSEEEVVEEVEEETIEEPEVQLNQVEEIAMEWGWRPKEEWGGDDDSWVDAASFVRKEREIRDKKSNDARELRHEIQKLHSKIESLAVGETKRLKAALDEQKARLLEAREIAVEEGDKDQFRKIDRELTEIEKKAADVQEHENTPENPVQAAFEEGAKRFAQKHSWYGKDLEMTAEANSYATTLGATKMWTENDVDEYYDLMEKKMKRSFPDRFTNPNKSKPSAVGGERNPSSGNSDWDKLMSSTPEAKKVFTRYVEKGLFKDTKADRERYAKQVLEDE